MRITTPELHALLNKLAQWAGDTEFNEALDASLLISDVDPDRDTHAEWRDAHPR